MSNPREIVFRSESQEADLIFYSHWGASTEVPQSLQRALARKQRWNDPSYLARIIFSELVKHYIDDETGFGISVGECNADDPIIVDPDNQTVRMGRVEHSFSDFIKLKLV